MHVFFTFRPGSGQKGNRISSAGKSRDRLRIRMKPLETTVEEVLRKAIQSEVETRVYYQHLAERAGSEAVRKRMLQLADGELVHRAKMERRYREEIGHAPPEPLLVVIELPPELADLDLSR